MSPVVEDSDYYKIYSEVSLYNYLSLFESLRILENHLKFGYDIPEWWNIQNRHVESVLWMDLLHLNGGKRIESSKFIELLANKLTGIHYLLENPEKDYTDRYIRNRFGLVFSDVCNIASMYLAKY